MPTTEVVVIEKPKKSRNTKKSKVQVLLPTPAAKTSRNQRRKRGLRAQILHKAGASKPGFDMKSFAESVKAVEHTPETAAGIAMIKQAINPCGEGPTPAFSGVTDGSGGPAANVKCRDDLLFSRPNFMDADTTESWGAVIFDTPYLASQLIMIRYAMTSGIPSNENVRLTVNALTAAQWDTVAKYPNFFMPTAQMDIGGAITAYTGPAFEISQLTPAAMSQFGARGAASNVGWETIRKWRFTYKGHTSHLNAPDLANEGRIIQALSASESSNKIINVTSDTTGVISRYTVTPPFDDTTLAMQDTQARQDLFKKGGYAVQRFWNEAIIWNEAEDVRPIIRVEDAAAIGVLRAVPNQSFLKLDGFDLNMGWIVENIRGLNAMAEVHIKFRSGVQVNVAGRTPWAPFMNDAADADKGAMTLLYKLSTSLPHCYEACFNDMGFLGGIISNILGGVTKMLPNILGHGANFLHGLIDKGTEKAERAIQKYSSYGGPGEYGDRGLSDRRRR